MIYQALFLILNLAMGAPAFAGAFLTIRQIESDAQDVEHIIDHFTIDAVQSLLNDPNASGDEIEVTGEGFVLNSILILDLSQIATHAHPEIEARLRSIYLGGDSWAGKVFRLGRGRVGLTQSIKSVLDRVEAAFEGKPDGSDIDLSGICDHWLSHVN